MANVRRLLLLLVPTVVVAAAAAVPHAFVACCEYNLVQVDTIIPLLWGNRAILVMNIIILVDLTNEIVLSLLLWKMSYSTFRVFGLVSSFVLQFLLMPTNI